MSVASIVNKIVDYRIQVASPNTLNTDHPKKTIFSGICMYMQVAGWKSSWGKKLCLGEFSTRASYLQANFGQSLQVRVELTINMIPVATIYKDRHWKFTLWILNTRLLFSEAWWSYHHVTGKRKISDVLNKGLVISCVYTFYRKPEMIKRLLEMMTSTTVADENAFLTNRIHCM